MPVFFGSLMSGLFSGYNSMANAMGTYNAAQAANQMSGGQGGGQAQASPAYGAQQTGVNYYPAGAPPADAQPAPSGTPAPPPVPDTSQTPAPQVPMPQQPTPVPGAPAPASPVGQSAVGGAAQGLPTGGGSAAQAAGEFVGSAGRTLLGGMMMPTMNPQATGQPPPSPQAQEAPQQPQAQPQQPQPGQFPEATAPGIGRQAIGPATYRPTSQADALNYNELQNLNQQGGRPFTGPVPTTGYGPGGMPQAPAAAQPGAFPEATAPGLPPAPPPIVGPQRAVGGQPGAPAHAPGASPLPQERAPAGSTQQGAHDQITPGVTTPPDTMARQRAAAAGGQTQVAVPGPGRTVTSEEGPKYPRVTPVALNNLQQMHPDRYQMLRNAVDAEGGGTVSMESAAWVWQRESSFSTSPVQGSDGQGSTGPMQMLPATFAMMDRLAPRPDGRPRDINNPQDNLEMGVRYLHFLSMQFGANTPATMYAYMRGPNAAVRAAQTGVEAEARVNPLAMSRVAEMFGYTGQGRPPQWQPPPSEDPNRSVGTTVPPGQPAPAAPVRGNLPDLLNPVPGPRPVPGPQPQPTAPGGITTPPDTAARRRGGAPPDPNAPGSAPGPTPPRAPGEPNTQGIPNPVLEGARRAAMIGGPGAVAHWMATQGHPQAGDWCGEFAAAVMQSQGLPVPQNPEVASNWRNWGTAVMGAPQPGDVAVRRGHTARRGGAGSPVATGALGSHVGMVESVDPQTGMVTIIGGNQGGTRIQVPIADYDFRRLPPQNQQQAQPQAQQPRRAA